MKYQIDILIHSLIKILLWLGIFLAMVGYRLSQLYIYQDLVKVTLEHFYSMLGFIPLEYIREISFYDIYQVVLTFLFLYIFYNYEKNNSLEFIIARCSYKKILVNKLIVSFIFVLFARLMYILAMYLFFNMFISIRFVDLVMGVLLYLGLDFIYFGYKFVRNSLIKA